MCLSRLIKDYLLTYLITNSAEPAVFNGILEIHHNSFIHSFIDTSAEKPVRMELAFRRFIEQYHTT